MLKANTIIIGIDPGLASTGYGLIQISNDFKSSARVLEYGVIRTKAKTNLATRLQLLYDQLIIILKRYNPKFAGCERLFFAKNVKTAMEVGQARGVVLLALAQQKINWLELTPPQVKQSVTGYGAADKKQVQIMAQKILQLTNLPSRDDAADALAIAVATQSIITFKNL